MVAAYVGEKIANDAVFGGACRDVVADPESPASAAAASPVCAAIAPEYSGLTHTERYLFDVHGILVLRERSHPSNDLLPLPPAARHLTPPLTLTLTHSHSQPARQPLTHQPLAM
jgi:hypothetical protein